MYYAKIINKETKLCEVGLGTNNEYYKSIGMTPMEVEQAYNGCWYEKGYAPEKSQLEKENEVKAVRDSMIDSMTWRVERAKEQQELGIETVDDYGMLLEYRQYLRDYPESSKDWYEHNPMTYEEWLKV